MSMVIVDILMLDENDSTLVAAVANNPDNSSEMTPEQIVDKLMLIDPDDLSDVQERLYGRLWGPQGIFTLAAEAKYDADPRYQKHDE